MPLLPLASFPPAVRLVLVFTLFALLQSLRFFTSPDFWLDVAMQGVVAPLLFYFVIGWQLRSDAIWPQTPLAGIRGFLTGIVTGGLFFLLLFFTFPEKSDDVQITGLSIPRMALIVPVVEEIYFRLVLTGSLKQTGLSQPRAIFFSGLFLALYHEYSGGPLLFPVGLAAGWLFLRFGVIASLSMHVVYNLAILLHAIS